MQEVNLTYYEIDGKNYLIGRKIDYEGSRYLLLVNENDYTDSLVQKEVNDTLEPVESADILNKILIQISKEN